MSTLWTPSGERPIPRPTAPPEPPRPAPQQASTSAPLRDDEPDDAEIRQLRDRLAATPPEVVIANHAYGMFELAGLHLSLNPPQLDQARLCIDALGYLVEGLGDRLGEPAPQLGEALSQLRLAYVQLASMNGAGSGGTGSGGTGSTQP